MAANVGEGCDKFFRAGAAAVTCKPPCGLRPKNDADQKPPLPYRSPMAEAHRSAHEQPAGACRTDNTFQQRLAASMNRHRRILDRLADESG